jgi:hypothetical protein
MKIDIVQIADRGVPNQERLHLRVNADTDLSFYAVIATSLSAGTLLTPPSIYAGAKPCFWFNRQSVKAGDGVILYTGSGKPNSTPTGLLFGTNYFFYWGLPATLWGDPQTRAVLFEIQEWATGPQEQSSLSLFGKS